MAEHRTFFEILGINETSKYTDEQVKVEFERRAEAAMQADGAIPDELSRAFELLHSAENRRLYARLLHSCRRGEKFTISPGAPEEAFRQMCDVGGIRIFEDPRRPNVYEVRLPDQPAPSRPQPRPQIWRPTETTLTFRRVWGYLAHQILLFQVFRGRTRLQILLLVAGYAAAIALLGVGTYAGTQALLVSQAERAAAERRALLAELRRTHRDATQELDQLNAALSSLTTEFEHVTKVSLDVAASSSFTPSGDLGQALLRTPVASNALAEILKSRPKPAERDGVIRSLAAVEHRLTDGSFGDEDRETLQVARAWIAQCLQTILAQSSHLDQVRAALKIDDFDGASNSSKRSSP